VWANQNRGEKSKESPECIQYACSTCRGVPGDFKARRKTAERVSAHLEVDRFLLEYDDERSGTFSPLRFVPKGKIVVLGLISSKVPRMGDSDKLRKRIDEASKCVPHGGLALSSHCGFASACEGNPTSGSGAVHQAR
jgi:5-methyltetrahydropteroyltriglutamate--homocysteine methyltransferase